ncbi:S1 family peptidase [Jiella marina]|uniref:S1 family peptidase n=1 Tax=Jiella sp. LLJ827 TaxID=2917712 RepID=UPI0021018C18|nr:S1 family peptidase [Jiella sp. LLJ827]MCQ0988311.1 S1 family peptidase [Jiella sp. LLJ827]
MPVGADRHNGSDGEAQRFSRLVEWLDSNADLLLDNPDNNLVAVGIGKKSAGRIDDDSPFCITGFVEEKLPKKVISSRRLSLFAEAAAAVSHVGRPQELDFEIDVVETGSPFRAQPGLKLPSGQRGLHGGPLPTLNLQKRFEAVRKGIGITNPHRAYPNQLSVGTLGFFVRDDDGRTYLVSNNHVIADGNKGRKGDSIVQPGTLDLTQSELNLMPTLTKLKAELQIATLSAFVDIQFHDTRGIPFNEVDCAAAELTDGRRDFSEIARVGLGGNLNGVATPFALDPLTGKITGDTRVYKAGRTTGWTEGEITQLAVVTDVRFGTNLARFRNQLGIFASPDNSGAFSRAGDSGSAIVNSRQEIVGLLFAGSESRTLANPIQSVLDALRGQLGVQSLTVI